MNANTPLIPVVTTIDTVRSVVRERRGTVALVPTMGALHGGHLALVEQALNHADTVVVSIFVNPLQFGAGEDLDTYPQTLEADRDALAPLQSRLDATDPVTARIVVFAPPVAEMYPDGQEITRVTAPAVGALFEGASRPGHFDGMLTVVAKLLAIATPQVVVFGQKDAQQVFLVERMIRDLNIPVRVLTHPTVRDDNGLAKSSRNQNLSEGERRSALALHTALSAAASESCNGASAMRAAGHNALEQDSLVRLDYLEIVNPQDFLPVADDHRGPALIIVAARVGATRLIDNEPVVVGAPY